PSAGGTGVLVTLSGSNFSPSSDSVWFGGIKFTPSRTSGSTNTLMFTVPQTLFQCDAKTGQECLAVYQPTPLGYYQVKVENSSGKVSNAVNYQVTSNGTASAF
ncbi:MAG: IPT/TIG domain-containing protein, partial [Minisyncoccia bacterium]